VSGDELSGSRVARGPYRHAYACGEPPSWRIAELLEIARAMVADEPEENHGPLAGLPAGYTYFGQFLAHDVSQMSASDPMQPLQPPWPAQGWAATSGSGARRPVNLRSPRLDLQVLYGSGPQLDAQYYRPSSSRWSGEFHHGLGVRSDGGGSHRPVGTEDDLLRTSHGKAVLPDQRNDENVLLSQVHLALQKAHNRCLGELAAAAGAASRATFLQAQRLLRWHVQWLVLEDYLPRILHATRRVALARTLRAFEDGEDPDVPFRRAWRREPWLPLEFVLAGFRFGHVLPRPSYRLNARSGGPFRLMPASDRTPPEHHLAGGRPLPVAWTLDWDFFFDDRGAARTQYARPIAPRVSASLGALPVDPFLPPVVADLGADRLALLPFLTLLRGAQFGLPTGQTLARVLRAQGRDVVVHDSILGGRAPLWFYLLAEAERDDEGAGATLGRLGSEIVLQTWLGLIAADESSYLRCAPGWRPSLGRDPADARPYGLAHLLRYAW
jgi:hypothetical protein